MRLISKVLIAAAAAALALPAFAGPIFDGLQNDYNSGTLPDETTLNVQGMWAGKVVTPNDTLGGGVVGTFPVTDPILGSQLYAALDQSVDQTFFLDMTPADAQLEYNELQTGLTRDHSSAVEALNDATHHELAWTASNGQQSLSMRTSTAADGTSLLIVVVTCEEPQGCTMPLSTAAYQGTLYIGYYYSKIL